MACPEWVPKACTVPLLSFSQTIRCSVPVISLPNTVIWGKHEPHDTSCQFMPKRLPASI